MKPRYIIPIALTCFCAGWLASEMYSLRAIDKPAPTRPESTSKQPNQYDDLVITLSPSEAARIEKQIQEYRTHVPFIRVVDGDTIKVHWNDQEHSVRMLNINTPERGKPGFKEATDYLKKLIGNSKSVRLEFAKAGDVKKDRYGRLLAYVLLKDRNLCLEMVKAGHSKYYVKYGKSEKYDEEFTAASMPRGCIEKLEP